jgi:oxalate decarboxylase/phosphoglucose isomerase-like protein (cupin superfamily)
MPADLLALARLERSFGVTGADLSNHKDVTVAGVLDLNDATQGRLRSPQLVEGVGDLHLYRAYRETFKPVATGIAVQLPVPLGAGEWHGDLVRFSGADLPNGEPCRSAGHWNPRHQAEIFQVLDGSIDMLTGIEVGRGRIALFHQRAQAGEIVVAPAGGWHVTYAADGPATVFNIYSGPQTVESTVRAEGEKYVRRAPLPVWLTRSDEGGLQCVSEIGRPVVYEVPNQSTNRSEWLHEMLAGQDIEAMNDLIADCDPQTFLDLNRVREYATNFDSPDSRSLALPYSTQPISLS